MIHLTPVHQYIGPNIYGSQPLITVRVKVEDEALRDAAKKAALINQKFAKWFSCKLPEKPGKQDVAELLLSMAKALLNEVVGRIHVAVLEAKDDGYIAALGYHDPQTSFRALHLAGLLYAAIESEDDNKLNGMLKEFWDLCQKKHPDFQAEFLIDYCEANDIPYRRYMPNMPFWQYGAGKRSLVFFESSPVTDNSLWSKNKMFSKGVFEQMGAPIAASMIVQNESELHEAVKKIGFPCVTKPLDMGKGTGVRTNLTDMASLVSAFRYAKESTSGGVMVERFEKGEIHRLLVIRGKLYKCIRRDRPFVTGDGKTSVLDLLKAQNSGIIKKMKISGSVGPTPLDDDFVLTIKAQGFRPQDVPKTGETIIVRGVAVAEQGSLYMDVTEKVHPDTKQISEALASSFGIEVCGLDFISEDISRSCFEAGIFIEINTTPGLRTPERTGTPRLEMAGRVLGDVPARLPLMLVVAEKEHHSEIRNMLPQDAGLGWVCGVESGVGSMAFPKEEKPPHLLIDKIIRNQGVTHMLVVCEPEAIVKLGMPADKAETVVIYGDVELDKSWEAVLCRHSKELLKMKATAKLKLLMDKIFKIG